ncbi:allatotropins-like [Anopheles bellator]|uniref:allatotropins-like n=1 Tax=Anopheles bellator TaxID=139047 RepID=UPI002648A440|nr:allatotropins-like [Anopheles bellator]XP_058067124.1 allatotropins-like [Anopheles bellator]XP_058067132.1 allatotropins-like [Anopheles bellator]XP_058067140.1 allatotropins-like [Anopheles bellator]XP_058067148.1 allatotropins-like [Anopheles bellator]
MEIMKISIYKVLIFVALATVLLCCQPSEAGPARQLASLAARASKIPRSIRAPFRNQEMMTARGFGKRRAPIGVNYGGSGHPPVHGHGADETASWADEKHELGKLIDDFAGLDSNDPLQQLIVSEQENSFPLEWFANEMSTNPTLAKSILQRFVDTNRDGLLEASELLPAGGASPNDVGELF